MTRERVSLKKRRGREEGYKRIGGRWMATIGLEIFFRIEYVYFGILHEHHHIFYIFFLPTLQYTDEHKNKKRDNVYRTETSAVL